MDGKLLIIGVLFIASCAGKNILEVVEDEIENMNEPMYADDDDLGKALKMNFFRDFLGCTKINTLENIQPLRKIPPEQTNGRTIFKTLT